MTARHLPTSGPVAILLSRLQGILPMGAGWKARCPAHDDRTQSLKIDESDKGDALVHCHAGCPPVSIVTAVGLTLRDLFAGDSTSSFKPTDVIAEYHYRGVTGEVLFRVERTVAKQFPQSRPDGKGGWIYKLAGVQRVPYHLPELLAGIAAGRRVFIVEGEKDVHALEALGLVATTSPGGAGKWRAEYTEYFRGARVICLPDNDDPGREHVYGGERPSGRKILGIAPALAGVVKELRVIELPDLPDKGDVSDWIRAGGTVQRLKELVLATTPWDQPAPPAPESEPTPIAPAAVDPYFPLTDVWNAERLAARHGEDLRYVVTKKEWHIWDGTRWRQDKSHEIIRRAIETVKSIYAELGKPEAKQHHGAILKHAVNSEKGQRLREMIRIAEALGEIPIAPVAMDRDPWAFNVANGTIDLRTGELRPHDRGDLLTRIVDVVHDPDSECPRWLAFLDRIFGSSAELITYIQRAVGYSLTGTTGEQCLFFAHGPGANGKSVFLKIVRALAGEYGEQADFTTFLEHRSEGPRSDLARLEGARFVSAVETREGQRLADGLVKQLTGGDALTVRALYANEFTFEPTFKLWFASNHRPLIKDAGDAMWRRMRLIPFTVQIPESEQDPDLANALLKELPGILNWGIDGCLDWQERGLGVPSEVRAATANYRTESDLLGAFLEECCIVGPGLEVAAHDLHERYKEWAQDAGEKQMSKTMLGKRLGDRPEAFQSVKRNTKHWIGLRLRRIEEAQQVRENTPNTPNDPGSVYGSVSNTPVNSDEHSQGRQDRPGSVGSVLLEEVDREKQLFLIGDFPEKPPTLPLDKNAPVTPPLAGPLEDLEL